MIDINDAYKKLAETVATHEKEQETIASADALGRILAKPVLCQYDHPSFNQSAMDGIAFAFEEGRREYGYIGTVAAGDVPDAFSLDPGTCVRIMTGAPVPSSADTVVMVEYIEEDGDLIRIQKEAKKGQHIRHQGENFRAGDELYPTGTVVTPDVISGLCTQGIRFIQSQRRLRVGVAATGDEVVDYRRPLWPGQVYNSNAPSIQALLSSAQVEVINLGVFPDNLEQTSACLKQNSDLDAIILSGGVSMGNFDLVPEAAMNAGYQEIFHKIKMKPGKPLWFGVNRESKTLLFGLPGNPVSALTGARLFVKPSLEAMSRGKLRRPKFVKMKSNTRIVNKGDRTLYVGVRFMEEEGHLVADVVHTSGSGDILNYSKSESLAEIPGETIIERGDYLQILLPFRFGIG